jgi:beta-lactamase superfamily II metal-dependent hydrolase
MYEVDFVAVGKKAGDKCGDAIALRFVPPGSTQWAQVIIDAGFKADGKALVEHVNTYYDPGRVDLAILTHPDEDHINGMGEVLRGLSVEELWLHRIGAHGGGYSRRNASSAFLDRLIGQPGQAESRTAFVSVSPGCSHEHPSGRVINAYERRGCRVIATAGEAKCSINGVSLRTGWVPATPLGPMVEEPETEA